MGAGCILRDVENSFRTIYYYLWQGVSYARGIAILLPPTPTLWSFTGFVFPTFVSKARLVMLDTRRG